MAMTSLNDDLLQEFTEECYLIDEQIELLDPLGNLLMEPEANRLVSKATLFVAEVCCYLLGLASLGAIILFEVKLPLKATLSFQNALSATNPQEQIVVGYPKLAIYTLYFLLCVCLLALGALAGSIRRKNRILSKANKVVKTILGQHLERQAVLDAIDQRHFLNISGVEVVSKNKLPDVNEVENLGY